jgi:hypothetical protein
VVQGVGKGTAGGRGWKRLPFAMVELDGFLDDSAELGEDLDFVRTVASPIQQAWRATHEAVILFRPRHDLGVTGALSHLVASRMALATARTWYFLASSPCLPETTTGLGTFI